MSYSTFEVALAPTYLKQPFGVAWNRAHGIVKDYYINRLRQAVLMRFPGYASPDALGAIGDERGIMQGVDAQLSSNETNAAYAARLQNAWGLWYWGGTAYGMLTAFAAQGFKPRLVQQNGTSWNLDGSGNLVVVNGTPYSFVGPSIWNSFVVLFDSVPSSWTNVVSPPTASTSPNLDEVNKLRRIIKLWKPAFALCIGIAVVTSGSPAMWGDFGATWGTGHWGATVVWFGSENYLTWTIPPGRTWGGTGLTWGGLD